MNRKIIFPLIVLFSFFTTATFAQLQNGTIAPDWTLTDINKKVWHLYDLTSKGKTVFIDISATWCGPCWRYHQARSLDSLYEEHGPNGTIDKSCYVFFIEGDGRTDYSDLTGTGHHTVGNWVKGTDFPIIDPGADTINGFCTSYNITFFPTIYMICPDNKIYLVGPGSMSVLFQNTKSGCAPVVKKGSNKNFKSDEENFTESKNTFFTTPLRPLERMFFLMRKRFSFNK